MDDFYEFLGFKEVVDKKQKNKNESSAEFENLTEDVSSDVLLNMLTEPEKGNN